MECTEVRELLSDLIEDNLQESQALAVRNHVRGCEACGCELLALGRVTELLQEWSPPPPPTYVWSNLQRLLPAPTSRHLPTPALRLSVAFAAACVALLVTWAFWVQPELNRYFEGTPAVPPGGASAFEGTPPPAPGDGRLVPMIEHPEGSPETAPVQDQGPATSDDEDVVPRTAQPVPLPNDSEPPRDEPSETAGSQSPSEPQDP